jgi:hypothetical protein
VDELLKKLALEAMVVAVLGALLAWLFISPWWQSCCGVAGNVMGTLLLPAFMVSIAISDQFRPIPFVLGVSLQFLGIWYPIRLAAVYLFPEKKRGSVPYGPETY